MATATTKSNATNETVAVVKHEEDSHLATLYIVKKNGTLGKGLKWMHSRTNHKNNNHNNNNTTTLLIGRDPQCDVRVQLLTASRRHCMIRYHPTYHVFTILNRSRVNPTTLQQIPMEYLRETVLMSNAKIGVGDRSFLWVYHYDPPLLDVNAMSSGGTTYDDNSCSKKIPSDWIFPKYNHDVASWKLNSNSNIPDTAETNEKRMNNCENLDPNTNEPHPNGEVTCELSKFVRSRNKNNCDDSQMKKRIWSKLSAFGEDGSSGNKNYNDFSHEERKRIRAELRAKYVTLSKSANESHITENHENHISVNAEIEQPNMVSNTPLLPQIQDDAKDITDEDHNDASKSVTTSSKILQVLDTPSKKAICISAALRQRAKEDIRHNQKIMDDTVQRQIRMKVRSLLNHTKVYNFD